MQEKEYKALISLLDDDDDEVIRHVEEKIYSLGNQIIPFLEEEWGKSFNSAFQRKIEDLIHTLQFDQLKERLVEWNSRENPDLLEGMWLVATYQYPDLELEHLQKTLDQLFYNVWPDFKEDLHPFDQIKILNNGLFNRLRFKANSKNFHAPGNSMINVVFETKKGNPISLCVLYMLLGQRLGMPVKGVNLPNLFICTYKTSSLQFYVNVFNRGLIFSKSDIDNYIEQLHINPEDAYYQPCSHQDIIKRVLRNLIISFEKLGEHHRSDEVKQLLHAIDDNWDKPGSDVS
jgi:regulator of sirC expression with transglutaminase-like and TPR domain